MNICERTSVIAQSCLNSGVKCKHDMALCFDRKEGGILWEQITGKQHILAYWLYVFELSIREILIGVCMYMPFMHHMLIPIYHLCMFKSFHKYVRRLQSAILYTQTTTIPTLNLSSNVAIDVDIPNQEIRLPVTIQISHTSGRNTGRVNLQIRTYI